MPLVNLKIFLDYLDTLQNNVVDKCAQVPRRIRFQEFEDILWAIHRVRQAAARYGVLSGKTIQSSG